jgi:tRNA-splicing ligase RtcB
VSKRAFARGAEQFGTLGSGNHFLEVQVIDQVHDEKAAERCGLRLGLICILIHSGSRGLGHQVCTDYLARFRNLPERYGMNLPDRQLACAPVHSSEGQDYIGAMRAAANFAWSNRHLLMVQTREVFERVFGQSWEQLEMHLVYDVAHNIAKLEEHRIGAATKQVWVHRKGATRAFPPGSREIPESYREIGQPVIIPGSMGTASWLLAGQQGSMDQTFGSTCHGAGRQMSRSGAIRDAVLRAGGRQHEIGSLISRELESQGIIALARTRKELAEEQPKAYKDVDAVVDVVHEAGLSKKVVRLRALGVIKG